MSLLAAWSVLLVFQTPPQPTLTGNFKRIDAFESKILGNKRRITVWLPPGFSPARKYPVLYVLDGQNLFDGSTSFIPGQEWRVDETAQALIEGRLIDPILIVGVDNAGIARINEFTPTRVGDRGGDGPKFARFLIEELQPEIQRQFPVLTSPNRTGLAGSSLGGLMTAWIGTQYPNAFTRLGVISPSVWWDNRRLLSVVKGSKATARPRIWLDMGTRESRTAIEEARLLRDAWVTRGWVLGRNLAYFEDSHAEHNEAAWARRFGEMLLYFYGTSR